MNYKDTTSIKCKSCGKINNVPTYANVGRFTKWHWWCKYCFQDHTFDDFFGCRTMEEALIKRFKI